MRAAFVASVAVLSLACFAAADTAFYQDAAFLELVCSQASGNFGVRLSPTRAVAFCAHQKSGHPRSS